MEEGDHAAKKENGFPPGVKASARVPLTCFGPGVRLIVMR